MAKHNYSYKIKGELDNEQIGKNINKIFPDCLSKAKLFFSSKEGVTEYVAWLQSQPEECEDRAELPMWEAMLREMEVA